MSFKNSFALAPVLPLCAGIDYTQMQNAPRAEVAGTRKNARSVRELADAGGGTRFHTALHAASLLVAGGARPAGRRAVVVVTDNMAAMPRFGSPSEREVSDAALVSGAAVCGVIVRGWMAKTLGAVGCLPSVADLAYKEVSVEPFAEATGGEIVTAGKGEAAFRLKELLSHYSIGYTPTDASPRGGFAGSGWS